MRGGVSVGECVAHLGRVQAELVGRRRLRAVVFEHHERPVDAVADSESPPPPSPPPSASPGELPFPSFVFVFVLFLSSSSSSGESTSATRRMARVRPVRQ